MTWNPEKPTQNFIDPFVSLMTLTKSLRTLGVMIYFVLRSLCPTLWTVLIRDSWHSYTYSAGAHKSFAFN
jgi:hypothetical protein